MLGSYGDLGDCGKISASTVFETITDITLLKYLKSLVTCHSLFKQTSKKENLLSSCFTSAPLKKSQRMQFIPGHCFRRIE